MLNRKQHPKSLRLDWLLTYYVFAWFFSHLNDDQLPALYWRFTQVVQSGDLRTFLVHLIKKSHCSGMVMVDGFEIDLFWFRCLNQCQTGKGKDRNLYQWLIHFDLFNLLAVRTLNREKPLKLRSDAKESRRGCFLTETAASLFCHKHIRVISDNLCSWRK